MLLLSIIYFFWSVGVYGFVLWLPTIVHQGSALSMGRTGLVSAIPYAAAIVAMVVVSQRADKTQQHRSLVWRSLLFGGMALSVSFLAHAHFTIAFIALVVAGACMYAPYGPFFAIVPERLPRSVTAEVLAVINSAGALGGFFGSYFVGWLQGWTGSSQDGYLLMSLSLLCAAGGMFLLEDRPADQTARSPSSSPSVRRRDQKEESRLTDTPSRSRNAITVEQILEGDTAALHSTQTHAPGPSGSLPITPEMLLNAPSGNLFGLSQNAGMGWEPARLLDPEFLILSTHGGLRARRRHTHRARLSHRALGGRAAGRRGRPRAARPPRHPLRRRLHRPLRRPHAGHRGHARFAALSQRRRHGSAPTDALAAHAQRRPRHRHLRQGPAGDDDGAGFVGQLPQHPCARRASRCCPKNGEDAGKVQTIGARFAQGQITLDYAAEMGCQACATPGGGCQFLGTAATSQVVAEALGLSLPHTALAPSGQPIWLDAASRSARAILRLTQLGLGTRDILTDAAIRNAMVLHAAFGGSTNLLLHIPAIAHAAGLRRPTAEDWATINRQVPRLVDALPNGPMGFATVQVFLAGGVPEAMLHLRTRRPAGHQRAHRHRRNAWRQSRLVATERTPRRFCASASPR